jgi:Fic family protein
MKKRIGETSYKQTAFGIIPRSKLIPLEIEGIKRAWDFVLRENKKGKISITSDLIKKLHQIGFAWIFPDSGGKYRKINVRVSKYTPPEFYLVPQLVAEFTKDLKARTKYIPRIESNNFFEELMSFLAWAHHRFLWIHPFQDYNGRIGRLLVNVILLNIDLPPIELRVDTIPRRKKYIEALRSADNGDYIKLEKIIQEAFKETMGEIK